MVMPRMLAHEFAHLLGSDHDGQAVRSVGVIVIIPHADLVIDDLFKL